MTMQALDSLLGRGSDNRLSRCAQLQWAPVARSGIGDAIDGFVQKAPCPLFF
jgi:hypothetical protein